MSRLSHHHAQKCDYYAELMGAESGQRQNYLRGLLDIIATHDVRPELVSVPNPPDVAPNMQLRYLRASECAATILRNECPLFVARELSDGMVVTHERPTDEPLKPSLHIVENEDEV